MGARGREGCEGEGKGDEGLLVLGVKTPPKLDLKCYHVEFHREHVLK